MNRPAKIDRTTTVPALIKQLIKNQFFGRTRYQSFWEKLYHWSLAGMNIGNYEMPLGAGELWVLGYVKRKLEGDSTKVIFDVGANTGLYSQQVLEHFGASAIVRCFEPASEPYQSLVNRLEKYHNVECFNFGFGDYEESRTLFTYAGHSGFSSLYDRPVLSELDLDNGKGTEEVQIRTLDSFCAKSEVRHISLLKLDVEGHELKVLRGARGLIAAGSIDFIQFEFGGTQVDSRSFVRDFSELLSPDFRIYRILKDGLSPIEQVNGSHEIFVYSNYLAVSCRIK